MLELPDWDESWTTGHPRLDEEHRDLVARLAQVARLAGSGARAADHAPLLDRLAVLLEAHFAGERSLMDACRDPGREEHNRDHDRLLAALAAFRVAWERESDLPRAWAGLLARFTEHQVSGADRRLSDLLGMLPRPPARGIDPDQGRGPRPC
jgi:hemerythrin